MTLVGEQNRAEHARLVGELRERLARAALGGRWCAKILRPIVAARPLG